VRGIRKMIKKREVTIRESAAAFMIAMAAAFLLQLLVVLLTRQTVGDVSVYIALAVNEAAFLAAAWGFARFRKIDLVYVSKIKGKLGARAAIIIFFISIFTIMAFLPLSEMFLRLLTALGYNPPQGLSAAPNAGWFFLQLFLAGLLPAFCEEILLRGVVLSGFKEKTYVFAIVCSALFFSLMHGSAVQTIHQFGLGLSLGAVFLITRSFWAPFLLHLFNNAISLVIGNYIPVLNNLDLGDLNYAVWAAAVPIGLIGLLLLLRALKSVSAGSGGRFKVVEDEEFARVFGGSDGAKNVGRPFKKLGGAIKSVFQDIALIFKKGGLHILNEKINTVFAQIDDDTNVMYRIKTPFEVWIAFGLLCINWLINFGRSF